MRKYIKILFLTFFLTFILLGGVSFEEKAAKSVNTKIYDITGKEVDTFNRLPGIYFIIINGKAKKIVIK